MAASVGTLGLRAGKPEGVSRQLSPTNLWTWGPWCPPGSYLSWQGCVGRPRVIKPRGLPGHAPYHMNSPHRPKSRGTRVRIACLLPHIAGPPTPHAPTIHKWRPSAHPHRGVSVGHIVDKCVWPVMTHTRWLWHGKIIVAKTCTRTSATPYCT